MKTGLRTAASTVAAAAVCLCLPASAQRTVTVPQMPRPPQVVVMRKMTESAPAAARLITGGLAFREPEAVSLRLTGDSPERAKVDAARLMIAPYDVPPAEDGPQVLIVHTHTTEAYTPSEGYIYRASDTYRTEDALCSVVRVGDELKTTLEAQGIGVIHDCTVHDQPSFSQAYNAALRSTEAILEKNPSVRVILDVHRDAFSVGGVEQAYLSPDDPTQAQVLLVVGDGGNYGYDGWRQNLGWNLKIYAAANRVSPGLVRTLRLDHARYNQHLLPGAMLVEVGAAGNTLPQALAAARAFGEVLAQVLTSLAD